MAGVGVVIFKISEQESLNKKQFWSQSLKMWLCSTLH